MSVGREFDVVLFGATGFTGGLTADYLAAEAPTGCRWAVAGRDVAKLAALRDRLAVINPACAKLELLHADVTDPPSLRAVAARSRVVASTVGPYLLHGEPLVAACAEEGTDYLDLTGEPEFTDRMYLTYHARASVTGARLVHCCGFDSIPADLGTYFTVAQLPAGVPIQVQGYVSGSATFSGGTLYSAVTAVSRLRKAAAIAARRRRVEGRPTDRRVRGAKAVPRYERTVGAWALPAPVIDPQVVLRSARALDRYGPDFSYGHHLTVSRLPVAAAVLGGIGAAVLLAQVPPGRRLLLSRARPGEGPSEQRRAKSWFRARFVAQGGGRRVLTEVSGGDPGYGETAKMLAESALCLAFDDLPSTAGQVTTAVAMGDALIRRLTRAGIGFRVVDERALV
ncbi:saccharopine dehydrogenase [Actinophytocola xinjiangensis]|uniref:Saccharopine dehydrogenase n=1 Tax=Actinophytocola xinjiangensis TaxID=485602 RepID=A0A7Z0WD27_9PSEU|nr:saccharopine dehydrogenase NADP-binding domain-containing protein [Actinophytocola xinjiangensis]OLF04611.1 saccharopine dehydrogenase [Actinophytocola xinjiangensis]